MTGPEVRGQPSEAVAPIANANPAAGSDETELASNYCPRCSARLASRSCKLICAKCGYYMSCSDFY